MITRYSRQREALIQILKNTDSHPTADRIYDELRKEFPNVSLATVYRNLKQLAEQNMVLAIDVGTGSEHYDGDVSLHYHFACKECGRVYDIHTSPFRHLDEEVSKKTGFDVDTHSLIFFGKCKECKN